MVKVQRLELSSQICPNGNPESALARAFRGRAALTEPGQRLPVSEGPATWYHAKHSGTRPDTGQGHMN